MFLLGEFVVTMVVMFSEWNEWWESEGGQVVEAIRKVVLFPSMGQALGVLIVGKSGPEGATEVYDS